MKIHFTEGKEQFQFDLSEPIDISIPISGDNHGVLAFGASAPQIKPLQAGSFIGDVKAGGSCNCSSISFTPHCNGTHTESIGHIIAEPVFVTEILKQSIFLASLITIEPIVLKNGDQLVTETLLREKLSGMVSHKALIIRTTPNNSTKLTTNYSGTNPAYLEPNATAYIASLGVEHLLLDLPSLDREDDGGKLLAHRAFWKDERKHCTVTELTYIPDAIKDGVYLLDLQVAPILSDAAPSRPILYKMR